MIDKPMIYLLQMTQLMYIIIWYDRQMYENFAGDDTANVYPH